MYSPELVKILSRCILLSAAMVACARQDALAAVVKSQSADITYLLQQGIELPGKLVAARRVTEKGGERLLTLVQTTGKSQSAQKSNRAERTDLRVTYYARSGNNWVQEWVIRDFVDCPGLDHEAEFFPDSVTVTDLNANGKAEVTVAYSLFCGGGIDPSTLKVIMREGPLKFAMRGTTIIQTPGNAPFGGEANYDQSLDKAENSAFKKHIMAVREKVVIKNYE